MLLGSVAAARQPSLGSHQAGGPLFIAVILGLGCPLLAAFSLRKGARQERPRELDNSSPIELHTVMCNNPHMATNLALDDNLIEEARRAGRHKTKKDAVTAALAEYVQRRKQLRILKAFGSFDFDPKYDYKAERRRKRS
jgi:Arc/MetJ family transcription regulator